MTQPPAPYGTPEHPRISVRGEAQLDVDPDIARLDITLTSRHADRQEALAQLTARNNHTLEILRSYEDALHRLATGTFSLTPELTKSRTERIRTYHSRVHLTAHLTDFTALGELTTRLADNELTHTRGPLWSLKADSPARRQARRQAVQEAVRRAREYADALGTTLDALLEIADIGTETPTAAPHLYGAPPPPAGPAAPGAAAPPTLDLEPRRQTVRAQVNARFTLHPPTL